MRKIKQELTVKKIKIGKNYILGIELKLLNKKLIVLRGSKGYIMCGYLDLKVAEKFKDCAAKIIGVSSLPEALKARICYVTGFAKKKGINAGQSVRQALERIV